MKNDLPKGWTIGVFKDLAYIEMGQSPEGSTYNSDMVGMPLLNGPTEFTERYPRKIQWTSKPSKICNEGDILICVRGSSTGRINISNDRYCIGRGVAAIRGNDKSLTLFLEYLIQYVVQKILILSSGSTFPSVDKATLSTIPISIPPLPEQQKIAQILSTWDKAIQTTQHLLDKLESRKKGMMQGLLSGKEKGLETVILEELGDFTKGMGITKVELVEQGIPCIRYGEIYTVHHFVVSKFYSFISKETAKESRKIAKNDILFAGSGETLEDIGKAVVFIGNEEVYAGGDIIIFSPTNINLDSTYLSYLLNSEFVRKQIRTFGQGQSVVHLYTRDISKIKIILPPLAEQTAIAKILNTADAEIQETKAYLKTLKHQKKGLMQSLLTGKIIVKTKDI